MLHKDVIDETMEFLRTTKPFNRCNVEDVTRLEGAADVRLALPTEDHVDVFDLYEDCKQFARSHTGDGYRLSVTGTHSIDTSGEPYFNIRVMTIE